MKKFLAYSTRPANLLFLLFVVAMMCTTPFYWLEGGLFVLLLCVVVLAIYGYKVAQKIRRGLL